MAKVVSISVLVISLPILYASLLRVPPSTLARDTTFWFLMSNSIIAIIAADSGVLRSGPISLSYDDDDDLSRVDVPVTEAERHRPAAAAAFVQDDESPDHAVPSVVVEPTPTARQVSGVVVHGAERALLQLQLQEEASDKATDANIVDHASDMIKLCSENEEDDASRPNNGMSHAFVLPRDELEEETAEVEIEPTTTTTTKNKINHEVIVKGDEVAGETNSLAEEEAAAAVEVLVITTSCSSSEHGDGELETVDVNYDEDKAFAEREGVPWTSRPTSATTGGGSSKCYWKLSDEELNRRVEEFITRFNQEMRLQEAGV